MQDTFLTAIEARDHFDGRSPVLPWLLGILANHAHRQRRRAQRRLAANHADSTSQSSHQGDPADAAHAQELREALAKALSALPEVYRPVLTLHLQHGLTAKQIAAALERPAGTVRTQVVRGVEMLRKLLPVGFGVAAKAALVLPRGLAAVREAVLVGANHAVPGAASAAAIAIGLGGWSILMQKSLAVGLALVVALAVVWWQLDHTRLEKAAGADTSARLSGARDRQTVGDAPALQTANLTRTTVESEAPSGHATLTVRVAWSDDTPASGVHLFVAPLDAQNRYVGDELLAGRTDAAGEVTLTQLAPGKLHVRTDRQGSQVVEIEAGRAQRIDVRLDDGIDVRGEVVDANGRPAPNAEVLLDVIAERLPGDLALAHTDPSGQFTIRDLRQHSRLVARAPRQRPSRAEMIDGQPATTVSLRLQLGPPGHPLQGTIRDATGAAIPHALIGLAAAVADKPGYPRGFVTNCLQADSDGRFAVDWAPSGELLLLGRRKGMRTGTAPLGAMTIARGSEARGNIELIARELPAITGSVRSRDGKPLAVQVSAQLISRGLDDGGEFSFAATNAAADGSYRLIGLLPGSWRVDASTGAARAWHDVDVTPDSETRCDLQLDVGLQQTVWLKGPDSRPLSEWLVCWQQPHAESARWREVARMSTAADGSATAWGLAAGPVRILTAGPYRSRDACDPFPRPVHPEVAAAQPSVHVSVPAEQMPTARLSGRVLGATGKPLGNAEVQFYEPGDSMHTLLSNADGRFTLGPMAPARLRVTVVTPEAASIDAGVFDLSAGQLLDVGDVRLPAPAGLTLQFPEELDPARVRVCISRTGDTTARNLPGTRRGHRFVAALPAGDYRLYVHGPEAHPDSVELTLAAGEQREITLPMTPAPAVSLGVVFTTDEAEYGIANGQLTVHDDSGRLLVHDDLWGHFDDRTARVVRRELALLPGRYRVRAQDASGRAAAQTILVPRDGIAQPIKLELQ